MQEKDKKILIIVGSALGIILIIGAYFLLGNKEEEPDTTIEQNTEGIPTESLDTKSLEKISHINALKLNKSIFNHASFVRLSDISIEIETRDVGKDNPFSEI